MKLQNTASKFLKFIYKIIDPVFYSRFYIRYLDRSHACPGEKRSASVAITHFERSNQLVVALKNIYADPRISEIIILDDGSSEKCVKSCIRLLGPFKKKVRLFHRDANLGPFFTKVQVIGLCTNPWSFILDSDNSIFTSTLDSVFSIPEWNADTIYCPGRSFPVFDLRSYGDVTLDFEKFCDMKGAEIRERFIPFFNDGNYFVNARVFHSLLVPFLSLNIRRVDSAFVNYVWLSSGKKLRLLPKAAYYHRMSRNSHWNWDVSESIKAITILAGKLNRRERARMEDLQIDFGLRPQADPAIQELSLE